MPTGRWVTFITPRKVATGKLICVIKRCRDGQEEEEEEEEEKEDEEEEEEEEDHAPLGCHSPPSSSRVVLSCDSSLCTVKSYSSYSPLSVERSRDLAASVRFVLSSGPLFT